MKKKILLLLALTLSIGLIACDKRENCDIDIMQNDYINTNDSWTIDSFNDFICVSSDNQFNEDTQEYTITFKFKKPRKDKE